MPAANRTPTVSKDQVIAHFECGCQQVVTGREERRPMCAEHGKPIKWIETPQPRVRGIVQSPLKVD
jgi:hypothetical protein